MGRALASNPKCMYMPTGVTQNAYTCKVRQSLAGSSHSPCSRPSPYLSSPSGPWGPSLLSWGLCGCFMGQPWGPGDWRGGSSPSPIFEAQFAVFGLRGTALGPSWCLLEVAPGPSLEPKMYIHGKLCQAIASSPKRYIHARWPRTIIGHTTSATR